MYPAPRRTTARTTAVVAVLVMATMGVAACSSDSGSDTTTTTAAGATSAPNNSGSSSRDSTTTVGDATPTTTVGAPTTPTIAADNTGPENVAADVEFPATGVACVSGGAPGAPVLVTITGSLSGGAPDGFMTIRVLDGEDFNDLTGEITGGSFSVTGASLAKGDKEVVEAFIVTPGGETVDVTIAVQDHFGSVLDLSGAGAVAGTGDCPG